MTRAERRRLEREARKVKASTEELSQAIAASELRAQINASVRVETMAQRIAKKQAEMDIDEIYKAAGAEAYKQWLQRFERILLDTLYISFSLAIHDKFPRWGVDKIEELIEATMRYNDLFVTDYKRNEWDFGSLYAITFGRRPEHVTLLDDDRKPVVGSDGVPKSDKWKAVG